jgi:hypothetical protein
MNNSQLMDNMVSLHFIDFISWGVLDNGPLYCITLWLSITRVTLALIFNFFCENFTIAHFWC